MGAIISAHVPVHVRGRILPNYAHIDGDRRIPFWRELGEQVHAHDCKFILQLSHGGRQQDIAGVENAGKQVPPRRIVPVDGTSARATRCLGGDDLICDGRPPKLL